MDPEVYEIYYENQMKHDKQANDNFVCNCLLQKYKLQKKYIKFEYFHFCQLETKV